MKYKAFHKLSYGLYIVTTESGGQKYGYIGNTVFQVTSKPPQLVISSHKNNFTTQKIIDSGKFAVLVLQKEVNTSLIGIFGFTSGAEMDKFENINTISAVTGAPIIVDSSVAWFDCKVVNTFDVGTHILITGEVVESEVVSGEEPLTYDYYREKYRMLSPQNAPTYVEREKLEQEKEPEKIAKLAGQDEDEHEIIRDENGIYICLICGFRYDPEIGDPTVGIPPGTPFEDLPEDYKCPICNASKDYFRKSE
jgi:flavin reductase (DIM6/NTAB) family NADH-FMN oxidoreductase RutF/rubredoxin